MPKKRTTEQLRADFRKMYDNVPFTMRRELIAIVDNQPMSYNVCLLEIKNETKMGDKILRYLERLDLV